ncbi:MAG: cell envelope integrity protein TolA [Saprospiraceae bacterium]|nr:cell envelope integrity protein TolA [Saprospiraceae bacterium]
MKIINPLYDHAFKYLMQNNRMAKKVLSTLLECEVLELVVEQQEIVAVDESRGLRLYRLDFNALIMDEQGNKQKVLIELQKSKLPTNLLRFRSYLGENYAKREIIKNELGLEEVKIYPIISIYLLGYNVIDIPYLAINIDNKITNTVTKEEVKVKSDFVDLLTHKTRIIQIRRLSLERRSRLEQFLMLFNQTYITGDHYVLDLKEVPEEFEDIANYLKIPLQDETFRRQLKAEQEMDEIFSHQEAELAMKEEALREAQEREAAAKQVAEAERKNAQEARQREEEAKQVAAAAQQQQEQLQIQVAKYLLGTGMPIAQIAQMTGLSEEAVLNLK